MSTRTVAGIALLFVGALTLTSQVNDSSRWGDPAFRGMHYRLIGPFRGGRSLAVAGIAGDPETYYFGAAGGGVWKSTDGAFTWTPIFDRERSFSIGALAVAPSDRNVLYVGTGETALRGDIAQGDGIYKSTDGGKTWKNAGLRDSRAIGRILIHPRNPDIVYAAALGHPFGANAERGVFRSLDGGKNWEKVLYKDDHTGAIDMSFDPANPNVIYAALWQAQRSPWGFESGGTGSGIYRSTDGGTTWRQLQGNGLPKGPWGKIGISVAANSDRVYALIQAENGGLYRSEDGGNRWQLINPSRSLIQRAFYYMHIFADPRSPDTVYVLDVEFLKSTDGGRSFTRIRPPHGDNHALWIDPFNTNRMISGDDGGATVSVDGGKHWSPQTNQPTAQFYHAITDSRFPYFVYGAQQDNTTVAIASRTDSGVIDRPDWYPVGGGESGYIAPYPPDPLIVYAGGYEGSLTRFDKHTGQTRQISPWPEITDGEGAAKLEHRFQWTSPTVISPHDPNVLYHAGERLFESTDGGTHWKAISPDLTRNDKSKQVAPGGPIDLDDTGTEYYDTIFTVAESPKTRGEIWAGTDDGLVQLTLDGGKTWSNVTPKEMPEWARVSLVEASPFDAGTAYVAANHYQMDDLAPYIFKTADYGKSWTRIVDGIPDGAFARAVREDPKRRNLLYAGTEHGIYISFNGGSKWQPFQLNMPSAPVHDLVVKDNDLVVATHGRAFWILDDLSPVRQYSSEIAESDVHLYTPAPAIRLHGGGRGGAGRGGSLTTGENPPSGAIVYYYLKSAPKGEVAIEILDGAGRPVRRYSSLKQQRVDQAPADPDAERPRNEIEPAAGLNRFIWDLRYEPVPQVKGYSLFEYSRGELGPLALPGTYTVKLTAAGKTLSAPLELKLDPRVDVKMEDLQKQFDLLTRIHRDLSSLYKTVNQMQDVRAQLKDLAERLRAADKASSVVKSASDLDRKIQAAEDVLVNFKITSSEDSLAYPLSLDGKLAHLATVVQGNSDSAPTEPEAEHFRELSKKLDEDLTQWGHILSVDLASFQKMTSEEKIPAILVNNSAK